ncbi:MAG: MaoC family dehydratase [Roseomonas sp.]|nr:MaoC family dehydratase [Roseomonas sp.]MCA3327995.1 MaoC family dehydratase [Roseomonas sp.]MCA3332702.1 MaoC family dehydratase [Roseomonas sp.]MCA3335013.1 MaoC family dehydratase [Roseomonas sp.]MCA3346366.1 MaoC family dehydratase [Roseomonas sp.]
MRMVETPEALKALIGQELGVSDWLEVTQDLIDRFAEVTGDHQWIHVDVERAKREMPGGKTIAHGYLLLSLLPKLGAGIYKLAWPTRSINYGSDKVRIVNPVKAGARIRLRQSLVAVEDGAPGAHRITVRQTLEIENEAKPAMIADTIRMSFT